MVSVIRSAARLQWGQLRTLGSCDRLLSHTPGGDLTTHPCNSRRGSPHRLLALLIHPPWPPGLLPFRVHCRLPHWVGTPWKYRGRRLSPCPVSDTQQVLGERGGGSGARGWGSQSQGWSLSCPPPTPACSAHQRQPPPVLPSLLRSASWRAAPLWTLLPLLNHTLSPLVTWSPLISQRVRLQPPNSSKTDDTSSHC